MDTIYRSKNINLNLYNYIYVPLLLFFRLSDAKYVVTIVVKHANNNNSYIYI